MDPLCKMLGGKTKSLSRAVYLEFAKRLNKGSQDHARCFSLAASSKNGRSLSNFRTAENDPKFHTLDHIGLHYKIPDAELKNVLKSSLRPAALRLMDTFNENCLMVREPSVELNGYLKNINLKHPVPRFIYYGKNGAGKSTCLALTMHYCYRHDWIVVHVPWAGKWMRVNEWHPRKDVVESTYKAGRWDVPMDAAEWLSHFRIQNQGKLKDIVTTSEYTWTKREKAEAGTPIDEIINFGLNRLKFSVDVVGVVLKELREQANTKGFKVLVAIDAVNALFVPWNAENCITAERKKLMPDQLSMVHNFKKMLLPTWSGGAVVCTVRDTTNDREHRESYTPKYLLRQEGFEWMDPFVPILVPEYSKKETLSSINYFIDRNWIQNDYGRTDEGIKEIMFVSNSNPLNLTRVCSSL